jgi:hypothetical protein
VRKLLIGAITGAVMLAVAAIAFATTTQTYSQKYSTKKTNKSAGTTFSTASTEDGNAERNHQPKPARQFDITFPKGSKIDYKTVPVCKQLDESADQPCPKNTKVGSGTADALLPNPGLPPIVSDVTAYNRKKGLWLYVVPRSPGQAPVVLKPAFKGLTLKTHIDPLCVASTNQNGQCVDSTGQPGYEVVLTRFELTTKPFKKGKRIYIRTPKKCPKAGWKFQAKITYSDGTSVSPKVFQKCSK